MRACVSLIGIGILAGLVLGQTGVAAKESIDKSKEERHTYVLGKQGVLELDRDAIRKKRWTSPSPNPPVAAREAIEKANTVKKQMLKDDDGWFWSLESVTLKPLDPGNPDNRENKDCWYWLVIYEAFGDIGGQPSQLEVAILMDGTVVQPVLRDYGLRKEEIKAKERAHPYYRR